MCGCSNKVMQEVPFSLRDSMPIDFKSRADLIKNVEQFNEYLSNKQIFSDPLSEDFTAVNAQYDENYFLQNDLIALIIRASSISYEGYQLKNVYKEAGVWVLEIKPYTKEKYVTSAMGGLFTYYISVEKDVGINGAEIRFV